MADETISHSPAAADVRAEIGKIQTDPTHPLHSAYQRNDPAYQKHVEGLYAKLPGAERQVDLAESSVKAGETSQEREQNDRSAVEDYAPVLRQTEEVLRKEWGDSYESNMDVVLATARELFSEPGEDDLLERLMSAYLAEGGSPLKANKWLLKVGQRIKSNG